MDEEGGAEVNFDPMAQQQVTQNHFANIAELLPDDVLGPIGSELNENYMQYKTSRKDWEDTYIKGLDLLGFKYVNPYPTVSRSKWCNASQCLLKRSPSFKRKLIKNYFQQWVRLRTQI